VRSEEALVTVPAHVHFGHKYVFRSKIFTHAIRLLVSHALEF
jgi:hypothetical protein